MVGMKTAARGVCYCAARRMGVHGLASYVAKHKGYKHQEHIDVLEWAKQKGFGM